MILRKDNKVKCIDDKFVNERTNPFKVSEINLPVEGNVYTVREVVKTSYGEGLRLKEVQNDKYYFSNINKEEEPVFDVDRFEKI